MKLRNEKHESCRCHFIQSEECWEKPCGSQGSLSASVGLDSVLPSAADEGSWKQDAFQIVSKHHFKRKPK